MPTLNIHASNSTFTVEGIFVYRDQHTVTATLDSGVFENGSTHRMTMKIPGDRTAAPIHSVAFDGDGTSSVSFALNLNVDALQTHLGSEDSCTLVVDIRNEDSDDTLALGTIAVEQPVNQEDDAVPATMPDATTASDYSLLSSVSGVWRILTRETWLGSVLTALRALTGGSDGDVIRRNGSDFEYSDLSDKQDVLAEGAFEDGDKTALDANTLARHTQGTDQALDTGGANEVTAAQAKEAYEHSTGDGSDHSDVASNTSHRGTTTGNPHNVTKSDVGLGNVPNEDATDMANWDQKGATAGQVPVWNDGWAPGDMEGGGGLEWSVISGDTDAEADKGYLMNASGNITLTLPANPSEGDTVGVCDFANKATTYTLTVARNGKNIEGSADDLVLNIDGVGFVLCYTNEARGWEVVSGTGGGNAVENASEISVDTSRFSGNLSGADSNVQLALETLDSMSSGGGGYNETFYPVISYPDTYGNLSGKTGRWTNSTGNEYEYGFDIPEPTDVLYAGSSATPGTKGSLNDHEWSWDAGVLTVADASGNPDGLPVNLWMADWWGVEGATPAFADEEDLGFPVHFDNATDQGIVCQFKTLPADVTTWTMKFFARSSDRSSSGTITIRALDRAIQTDGADKPTATTLATATFSLTADGSIVTISGTTANLDATTGEIPQVCVIRDVSEDSVATPMAVDLDTVEVQYAP
jgi:hypothetical protein